MTVFGFRTRVLKFNTSYNFYENAFPRKTYKNVYCHNIFFYVFQNKITAIFCKNIYEILQLFYSLH